MSKQAGFTIPELLVAIAVAAIASVLMVTAFVYTYASVITEQTRAGMTRDSQLFLRKMVEDIRLSNEIRQTNSIDDPNIAGSGGEWVTSDPANIIVATIPATDASGNLVYNDLTDTPYYHEVVYFGSSGVMYRRLLANTNAQLAGSTQITSCPSGTPSCPPDIEVVSNLENMLFEFFDVNDAVTNVPGDARSVQITINLLRKNYGKDMRVTNTTRMTLRNEN